MCGREKYSYRWSRLSAKTEIYAVLHYLGQRSSADLPQVVQGVADPAVALTVRFAFGFAGNGIAEDAGYRMQDGGRRGAA